MAAISGGIEETVLLTVAALCAVCYFKIHFVSDILYMGHIR